MNARCEGLRLSRESANNKPGRTIGGLGGGGPPRGCSASSAEEISGMLENTAGDVSKRAKGGGNKKNEK